MKGQAPFLGMMVKVEALSHQDRAKRSPRRQEKSSNEEMEEGPGAVPSCFAEGAQQRAPVGHLLSLIHAAKGASVSSD